MGGIVNTVLNVVTLGGWSILKGIAKLFGIYTHNETFTDIQISNLLTPGAADETARRNCKYQAKGNAQTYFQAYKQFQRDYRKKYSAQFMKRQGYAPSTSATTKTVTEAKAKAYLQSLYGYSVVSVESVKDAYLSLVERYRHAIRTISGYDYPTGQIVVSGKHYNNHTYVQGANETQVIITSTRLYDETIIANLTANYGYDGTYVTIVGEQYLVGDINSEVTAGQYSTICTHIPAAPAEVPEGEEPPAENPTLPDQTIYTNVQTITNTVTNSIYGSLASYAVYRVTSGEVGTQLRYWVATANTTNIYDVITVEMTAIIPVKEDNVMVDLEGTKLTRMLRKLNLSGDELEASIDNPDMDSAYLMTGLDPQLDDSISNKMLFDIFDYMATGSGSINISISKLSMKYTFDMVKSVTSGSIGSVGTVTRTNIASVTTTTGSGDSESSSTIQAGMILKVQVNSTEYRTIQISNFAQTYIISGNQITAYLDSTGGYTRMIIPLDLLNKLKYKDFVYIYERSLCLLAFSLEVVEVKWYETGALGTLMKIAAVVVFIVSAGSASSVSAVLWSMAITASIVLVATLVAKAIGGVFGAIVGAIITIAGILYGVPGMELGSADFWMMTANQTIGVINQSITMKMDELVANAEAFYEDMKTKVEELMEDMEEYDDINPYGYTEIASNYAGTASEVFTSISDYCSNILDSADMTYLIDYSQQIEYNIMTRNSVVAGVSR